MMIGTLLVVAASVGSMTYADPIFNLFDYDMCDDCDGFSGFLCDWFCESEEECSDQETTEMSTATSVGASSSEAAASTAAEAATTAAPSAEGGETTQATPET